MPVMEHAWHSSVSRHCHGNHKDPQGQRAIIIPSTSCPTVWLQLLAGGGGAGGGGEGGGEQGEQGEGEQGEGEQGGAGRGGAGGGGVGRGGAGGSREGGGSRGSREGGGEQGGQLRIVLSGQLRTNVPVH